VREHLPRLDAVWLEAPIFFVTTCTHGRRRILANKAIAEVLLNEWREAPARHHWMIGRYVIMPDHVHFFCAPQHDSKALSEFVGAWKSWTSRRIGALLHAKSRADTGQKPFWQSEFFDHLIRSNESYDQKWEYVRDNPVRAGLVSTADAWDYAGEIERLSF
jgi:REP element-mobilizing transposase RayT